MDRAKRIPRLAAAAVCGAILLGPCASRLAAQERREISTSSDPSSFSDGRIGPFARFVLCVAVDPKAGSTLYAGTGGGAFRSRDGGLRWYPFHPELGSVRVGAVMPDPSEPSIVLMGTGDGLFRSIRAAAPLESGIASILVDAIAIDPSSRGTMYAGTGSGVYKSVDGGTTWTQWSKGLDELLVTAIVVDPRSSMTLYAGTNGGGVFKSVDGARSWKLASGPNFRARGSYGNPSRSANSLGSPIVLALAIDPARTGVLYAGTTEGLFKTSDGGGTWSDVSHGLKSTFILALALAQGAAAEAPSIIYAGTAIGVVKTADEGASWSPVSAGMTNAFVTSLAIDPASPSHLYAGTDAGIFVSKDAGGNWDPLTLGWTARSGTEPTPAPQ